MPNIIRVGGGGASLNVLTVAVESGAVVTARSGTKVVTATSVDGIAVLKLQAGTWALVATKDGQTAEDSIIILDEYPVDVSFGLPLGDLAEGALVKLSESGIGVNFYLTKHNYESGLNGAGRSLLVRKDIHSTGYWNTTQTNNYSGSTIDNWFNNTYKSMLSDNVQSALGITQFKYTVGNGDKSVSTLGRSIFALSATEFGFTDSRVNVEGSALAISSILALSVPQFTRSPNHQNNFIAMSVLAGGGSIGNYDTKTDACGYRPCFTLPATKMVNPTPNADGSYTLIA